MHYFVHEWAQIPEAPRWDYDLLWQLPLLCWKLRCILQISCKPNTLTSSFYQPPNMVSFPRQKVLLQVLPLFALIAFLAGSVSSSKISHSLVAHSHLHSNLHSNSHKFNRQNISPTQNVTNVTNVTEVSNGSNGSTSALAQAQKIVAEAVYQQGL